MPLDLAIPLGNIRNHVGKDHQGCDNRKNDEEQSGCDKHTASLGNRSPAGALGFDLKIQQTH